MTVTTQLPPLRPNHSLKDDIRAYWSKRAETFDTSTGHRIENSAEAPAWQALFTKALGPLAGKRVLDLACGTGEISRMLLALGAEVTGVDFAEPMLERARCKHQGAAFKGHLADVENLSLEEDDTYDAVINRHLVWTLTDPHAAFAEWFRVLKPGGKLLIIDGDWVNTPPLGKAIRAIAQRLAQRTGVHGNGVDMTEHNRIITDVHYAGGLQPSQLTADLGAAGFADMRTHSMRPVYWWGMRKAPLADRLRLMASRRFAISAMKPMPVAVGMKAECISSN